MASEQFPGDLFTDAAAPASESAVEAPAGDAPSGQQPEAPAARTRTAAPRRSRARKTTTEAATPEAADQATAEIEAAPARPTRAPRTRRAATRTQAAPAPTGDTSEASTETPTEVSAAVAEVSVDAGATPAPTRARRSRAKKAAAPVETPDPQPEAEALAATDDGAVGGILAVSEVEVTEATDEAETEAENENENEADEEPTVAAVVPSFGLIFQAAEPVTAPRRRATRGASAPAPAAEVEPSRAPQGEDQPAPAASEGDGTDRTDEPITDDDGADSADTAEGRRRRRRGGRGRRVRGSDEQGAENGTDDEPAAQGAGPDDDADATGEGEAGGSSTRRRRRRRRGDSGGEDDPPGTVTRVREPRSTRDEQPTAVRGSTRLEAKKQRRREGREAGRRRTVLTEAEFLARRESVERVMVVRGHGDKTQIGVLEDGVLVEHYVSRATSSSMAGNVYLGRVQNVLPSMEAAFVDIGKGRNAVLYAGEVNWDAAGLEMNQPKRIENALTSGDTVLVQVTKDPIGHKGARLTSQISLPGRYLVYVPEGSMTGISRKLPDTERSRLKAILKEVLPDSAGVIVRTAAEGASEEELRADVERLTQAWERISAKAETAARKKSGSGGAPVLLHGEPDLTVRVIRDVFTEDFTSLVVSGDAAWNEVNGYVEDVAPDLAQRVTRWTSDHDVFRHHRIDEQLAKALDRKVWLPSGGSLVIDRTEAMTVVDVNTGKFVGSGGNLEETVTKNNIEAAEEIVRQLRLRDIGGIIVIDFIDMVLESNRDLVVRRLLECLGRDRTKHQVAEVTSLGLVQMTRKRVGSGLLEVFSETCEHCAGRGVHVQLEPVERSSSEDGSSSSSSGGSGQSSRSQRNANRRAKATSAPAAPAEEQRAKPANGPTAAQIAAAAHAAAVRRMHSGEAGEGVDGVDGGEELELIEVAEVEHAEVVEPVASVESVESAQVEAGDAQGASEPTPDPDAADAPEPASSATPSARGRRRRGRVVAPAGPPRAASENG